MRFFDRTEEIASLREIRRMAGENAQFTVVTGRRRIGKTSLVRKAYEDEPFLYFFVARKAEGDLCEDYRVEIESKLGIPTMGRAERFADVFEYLMKLSAERPVTLFIDEFQEFFRVNKSVYSDMQRIWDIYSPQARINLIVCGSIYSMMTKIFKDKKEPLYNRQSRFMSVRPFTPTVLKEILSEYRPGYTAEDLLALYAFTGGVAMVKDRFGTANAYFAIDKLVSGAVKQLQRTLGRITDSLLGSLPGADSVKSATNFFLNISLGYIDECCLSYTFYNRGQNAYKSACDGVVIYAQNWKHLLKNAAMTALTVIVSILVVTLVAFVLFGGAFRLLGWSGFVAFVLAVMLAWTIKFAFIDSWMMVKMMHGYMQVAPSTVITYDLYTQLSGLSSSFKRLFNESRVTPETVTVAEPASEPVAESESAPTPAPAEESVKPRFCSECGTPLKAGMAFCGNCGKKVG